MGKKGKFKFRLQKVLEFREGLKKEKERELAEKNFELGEAEEHENRILVAQDNSQFPDEEVVTMAELQLNGEYRAALRAALVNQRLRVLEAKEAVEEAREAYVEKAVEAEMLDTLKKKRGEEFRQERRREEQKDLNNMVIQRHRFPKIGEDSGGTENE